MSRIIENELVKTEETWGLQDELRFLELMEAEYPMPHGDMERRVGALSKKRFFCTYLKGLRKRERGFMDEVLTAKERNTLMDKALEIMRRC